MLGLAVEREGRAFIEEYRHGGAFVAHRTMGFTGGWGVAPGRSKRVDRVGRSPYPGERASAIGRRESMTTRGFASTGLPRSE